MQNSFLNKRHKHLWTFNVRHIFPLRVSFSSYHKKTCQDSSDTQCQWNRLRFYASWFPELLRCIWCSSKSPQPEMRCVLPPNFLSRYSARRFPHIPTSLFKTITIHSQLFLMDQHKTSRLLSLAHFLKKSTQHLTLLTQRQSNVYLNDGKKFRAMEWSMVFVSVPLFNGLWFWKVNHCHWVNG